MIFDGTLAVHLPTDTGPVLDRSLEQRLLGWVRSGTWDAQLHSPSWSAARTLAACMEACRAAGFRGLRVVTDADEVLAPTASPETVDAPRLVPFALPTGWTEAPASFVVHATRTGPQWSAALLLRSMAVGPGTVAPLVGSLRAAWMPHALEHEAALEAELGDQLGALYGSLRSVGRELLAEVRRELGVATMPARVDAEGDVHLLHGAPERFSDLLVDLDPVARAVALRVSAQASPVRPMPALRDDGTRGHVLHRAFVPSQERPYGA